MRRLKVSMVTIGILITYGIVLPISAGSLIVVDSSGKGDYSSIQQAIDRAESGDVLLIKAGEYQEVLNINKRLTIIGENRTSTIITPASRTNGFAIAIRAKGVVIKNLSITNRGSGIYAQAVKILSSGVIMENCSIYGTPVGVSVWSSNNIIRNCEFWNCKDEGIVLIGTKYRYCSSNLIEDCSLHDNCDGIEFQYATNNTIKNCDIYNNTHDGIDMIDSHSRGNLIVNCTITDNNVHGVFLSAENRFVNCSIIGNKDGDIVKKSYLGGSAGIKGSWKNVSAKPIILKFLNRINALHILPRLRSLILSRYGS